MAFLNPLLLLGLAAIAIPILLHLLRRRETRVLVFPALRYLTRTTEEHARIIRLRQILLLALRIAIVTLLVLAAARLVLALGGRDHPPAGLVLVLDNGVTAGAVVGEVRMLDSLRARAREALDRTGARDRVWIVPAGAPWTPAPSLTVEAARAALEEIGFTGARSDLGAALARASALLDAAAPEVREIVLVSDLGPGALPLPGPDAPRSSDPVTVAPPPEGAVLDRGIAEVRIAGGLLPRAGEPAEIQVEVRGEGAANTPVRVYLGDRLVASDETGENGTAILAFPPLPAGWVEGRVELDPDDLRADDVAHFAFRAIPPPTVAAEGSLSPFLLDALDVLADAGRIRRVSPGQPAAIHILGAGAPNVPPTGAAAILVPPQEPALLASMNRTLGELLPGWRLEGIGGEGSLEREVAGGSLAEALPLRPRVRSHFRIVPPAGAVPTPLLALADGTPWLVRTEARGGTTIVLASPVSEEASDLPTSAALVPLLDLLVSLPSGESGAGAARAGNPLRIPAGASSVETPGGTVHRVEGAGSFPHTGETGLYTFRGEGGELLLRTAVNAAPPREGAPLDMAEAVERLLPVWAGARAGDPWPDLVLDGRRGREVARPIAALLFLLLVAETWLAASGRGSAEARGSAPAGSTAPGSSGA